MAQVKLAEGGFSLMREGKQIVKIKKAEGKPSGAPKLIEVVFENSSGDTITNNYNLDPNAGVSFTVTSIFLKASLGNIDSFDTNQIPDLVGNYIEVEVVHRDKQSTKDPEKTMTFANISKIYGSAEPFVGTRKPQL